MTPNAKKHAVIQGKGLHLYHLKRLRLGRRKNAVNANQERSAHPARDHAVNQIVNSLPDLRTPYAKMQMIALIKPSAMEIMLRVQNHQTNQIIPLNVIRELRFANKENVKTRFVSSLDLSRAS
jgi:hypothetical protein